MLPASIWEQDEAYLAAAAVTINLADSAPHPPFFPLWVGIGAAGRWLGLMPDRTLQLASAILGALAFVPLTVLWSRLLAPGPAAAAAVLGLAAPGVWLLSARAFSGTAGTALVIAALACWTTSENSRRWLAAGSVAAALAVLIRPQLGLVVTAAAIGLAAGPARRRWPWAAWPGLALTVAGAGLFVVAAGGPGVVGAAVSRHAALHFGRLPDASRGLLDSGLAAVLASPSVAAVWSLLAVAGVWCTVRSRRRRAAAVPVAAALGAALVLVFVLSNPAHPRYAVPLVLLSSGFVVASIEHLAGRLGASLIVSAAVAAATALVLPAAATLRHEPSPPMAALDEADRLAADRGGVVVVDRTLHAFVVFRDAIGMTRTPVVFDHMLDLGAIPPPAAARTVTVFDDGHDGLVVSGERRITFSRRNPLLRRLGQDRFLDVTVIDGADLSRPRETAH